MKRISAVAATWVAASALIVSGLLLPASPALAAGAPDGGQAPVGLRVNGLDAPADLGDLTDPDYSWQVPTGVQSAYEVVVSSGSDEATAGDGDVWDSGKVSSADQLNVPHGGADLEPGEHYFWKVRTWDADDAPSPWSAVASFGTAPGATWADSEPIWAPAGIPGAASAPWVDYTLSARIRITQTALGIRFRSVDASNGYMWQFRGADNRLVPHVLNSGTYSTLGSAVNLPAGTLSLNTWTNLRIEVAGSTFTTYINDVKVDERTDSRHTSGTVGVRNGNSEAGQVDDLRVVETGTDRVLMDEDFSGSNPFPCGSVADGVLAAGNGVNCALINPATVAPNWAFLRTEVQLADKEVAWATLSAAGTEFRDHKQFVFKVYMNGEFVGLGPTNRIESEARYDGFDVTDVVRRGEANSIAALAYTTNSNRRFQAQLKVAYTDGSTDVFGTGPDWKALNGALVYPEAGSIGTATYSAPIENLDARQFPFGYTSPGFDDSAWVSAVARPAIDDLEPTPTGKVQEQLHDPVKIVDKGDGDYFVDFGRTWVGGVQYDVPDGVAGSKVELRFGETTSADDTVQWQLNTGNKYRDVVTLKDGDQRLETWGMRVFRYLEIVGAPEPVTTENLKALALVYPFDRQAATFTSSNENLNQVYDLAKNTIEALNVNFYTDSWTRERTAYEADAYLQQLSSLYLMDDLSLGRYTMNFFKSNRTWPTEWPFFVVLGVHDAWRQTGNTEQVADYYDNLKAKLRSDWLDPATGLLRKTSGSNGSSSCTDCDIVDWPTSQRDGYQFRQYNTVINALYYRALRDMAAMADTLGNDADATTYTDQADRLRDAMNERLYDAPSGRYDDGLDASLTPTGHYSLHASAFALAFGVPEQDQVAKVSQYVDSRGMACSVYCAGFLVQGLYEGGNGQAALDALTDEGTSSWMNMIKLGAGATMEAWDPSQKSNLSYSHPWAASPAFNIPSGLFGIQPLTDAYKTFQVMPQPGDLKSASIKVPTVRGSVAASFDHDDRGRTALDVTVPGNTAARVYVPLPDTVRAEFVPSHDPAADYQGREELPGGTYAVFEVGPGEWTFGPKAVDDLGTFQPVVDDLLGLGDAIGEYGDQGDLDSDDAADLADRVTSIVTAVRAAGTAYAVPDLAGAESGLQEAITGLREVQDRLSDADVTEDAGTDLAEQAAAVEQLMSGVAAEIRGLSVTVRPVEHALSRGQDAVLEATAENAGSEPVGPIDVGVSVPGWSFDPEDAQTRSLSAGDDETVAFSTTVPSGQAGGAVRPDLTWSFVDDGTSYEVVDKAAWAEVQGDVRVEDLTATHAPGSSAVAVTGTVANTGSVAVTGQLQVQAPDGWRAVPAPPVTVAAGAEEQQSVRVFVPSAYVDRDQKTLPVRFVGNGQVLATGSVVATLARPVPQDGESVSDHVDFGESVSEGAHAVEAAPNSGTSTEAGLTRRYAHSNFPGSWFSAEVAVPAGEPFTLVMRETFNTRVTKKYNVYVDDVLVHQQVYSGGAPAEAKTYQVTVDDPEVLDDDGTVRVKFEFPATDVDGYFDPSIADLWALAGPDTVEPTVSAVPTTEYPGDNGWARGPVTLTVSAEDDRGSTAPTVEVDTGTGWTAYDEPLTITGDGEHTVGYRASDAAANRASGSATVLIDSTPPVTEAVAEPAGHETRAIRFEVADELSGPRRTSYRLGSGDWQTYDPEHPVEVAGAGDHEVSFRSTDLAGNREEVRTTTVVVPEEYDAAPVTATVSSAGQDGWYGVGASLSLAADATGDLPAATRLEYRVGDGDWQVWSEPVPMPAGEYAVEYRAVDSRGIVSSAQSLDVRVDDVLPTATLAWDDRTLMVSGADLGGSGVRLVEYRVDADAWLPYVGPVTIDGRAHVVDYRATDVAGNVGAISTASVDAVPTGPAAAPTATTAPAVVGTLRVGQRLRANVGAWQPDGVRTSVQWTRDGAPIAGATGPTYQLGRADLGHRIGIVVRADLTGHATGVAQASRTERVAKAVARLTVKAPARARAGARVRVTVRVAASGLVPDGRVQVTLGGRKVGAGVVKKGRVVLKVRVPERTGAQRLSVVYRGTAVIQRATKRAVIRVR